MLRKVRDVDNWYPPKSYEIVLLTSRSGFTEYRSRIRASRMRNKKNTVRTCMTARSMLIFFVVRRTLKPAATRGVTCSKAAFISREYGMPMLIGAR